jgi:hypothetical protein
MRLNNSPQTLADFHTRKGDTIFSLGATEVSVRFTGTLFLVLYVDVDGGVQSLMRTKDADAWRLAIFISRHGVLPPSAQRKQAITRRGMQAIELGKVG